MGQGDLGHQGLPARRIHHDPEDRREDRHDLVGAQLQARHRGRLGDQACRVGLRWRTDQAMDGDRPLRNRRDHPGHPGELHHFPFRRHLGFPVVHEEGVGAARDVHPNLGVEVSTCQRDSAVRTGPRHFRPGPSRRRRSRRAMPAPLRLARPPRLRQVASHRWTLEEWPTVRMPVVLGLKVLGLWARAAKVRLVLGQQMPDARSAPVCEAASADEEEQGGRSGPRIRAERLVGWLLLSIGPHDALPVLLRDRMPAARRLVRSAKEPGPTVLQRVRLPPPLLLRAWASARQQLDRGEDLRRPQDDGRDQPGRPRRSKNDS